MPLKEKHDILPDNYELSLARLDFQVKRLKQETSLLEEYDNILKEQLCPGIDVDGRGASPRISTRCYTSFTPSGNKNRQRTKVRVVYDASANHH